MKNKILIPIICLFVFISCAQKPVTVKIPMDIEDRVPFEKFETIFIGGFDISSPISDPDPKKELIRFFTDEFQQAIKKKIEYVDLTNGSIPRLEAIKKKLRIHPNSLFITGKFTIDIKTRSIVKDVKKKQKKAFVKIQIWEMTWKMTIIDSVSLKTMKQMTFDSKMKDADPKKNQFNFKTLFDNMTERFMQNVRKKYKFQNRYLLKDRK
jgi:hypothetical protein